MHLYHGIFFNHKKKKKILPFVRTLLEDIILHEINQAEKDKYYVITFICGIKSKKTNS